MVIQEDKLRLVAEEAVKAAGSFVCQKRLAELEIYSKGPGDIVTNFDLESERLMKNMIRKNFPEHQIIAEETGWEKTGSDITWFIDPLDGTKAFIRANLAFVMLTAATVDSEGIIASAALNPFLNILYSATRSGPALLNGKTAIYPPGDKLSEARVLLDFSSRLSKPIIEKLVSAEKGLDGKVGRIFRFDGSISQHLGMVAQGTLDGALFWGTGKKGNFWDVAALILFCERTNVKVTDFEGNPISARSEVLDQIIAAPRELHQELLEWVNELKTLN